MRLYYARLYILLFLTAAAGNVAAQNGSDSNMVTHKFVYKSARAGEVYLVWSTDYWQTPGKQFWPEQTFLKDRFAYSKLIKQDNGFYTSLKLPYNSRINYFFWIPKNNVGETVTGWDTNLKKNYTSYFNGNNTIGHSDSKLYIRYPGFKFLSAGVPFFIGSVLLFSMVLFLFKKNRHTKPYILVTGFLCGAFVYMFVARAEIAGLFHGSVSHILASVFQDLSWLLIVAAIIFPLLYIFRKKAVLTNVSLALFFLIMIITVLSSIINIEVVKVLGTPFNYRWLYYSDFLREQDTRASINEALSSSFLKNICLIFASYLLFSIAVAMAIKNMVRGRVAALFLIATLLVFFLLTFYNYQSKEDNVVLIQNPVLAFILSVVEPGSEAALLKTTVPAETTQYISEYHHNFYASAFDSSHLMDNIVLFVSESTPQRFISLYDSGFKCTPNLKKWSSTSYAFTNMYAHIPSTPNSMLSLVSGIYPMIDYKSAISEKINLPPQSLVKLLGDHGWSTSLLFSADLQYAKMYDYAKNQGFSFIKDFNTMPCIKKFNMMQSQLKGLDDECLVENYFKWTDSLPLKKKFSILWTNQTHYPYYTDTNTAYATEDDNLNRYLNALHHTDKVFDELMKGLQERGKLKSTLVIFIGDHGEAFGTHNQTLHASRIYEENVHIPCMLFNPVLFNKREIDSSIHGLIDIDVTITHLLGLQKPAAWEGRSLFDTGKDGRTFFISPYADLILGTRNKNWKYIYNADTEEKELYNLANDPNELVNIANRHPEVVKKEQEILAAWVQYEHKKYGERKK